MQGGAEFKTLHALAAMQAPLIGGRANVGYIIPRPATPPWFRWIMYVNPLYWALYGLVTSQLGDSKQQLEVDSRTTTVEQHMRETYDYRYDFLGYVVLIQLGESSSGELAVGENGCPSFSQLLASAGFACAFSAFAIIALAVLKHQKR